MNILLEYQPTYLYEFYRYLLTPKQIIKFYSSSKYLLKYLRYINIDKIFYTPKNYIELKHSVNNWCYNRIETINSLGHISSWNTKYITNMNELFMYKYNFKDDISDWNVSNVLNMDFIFYYTDNLDSNICKKWYFNKNVSTKNIRKMY